MKDLKIYYWEKTGYHNGASFAIAESLQEAKELIIKEFKTNYLKDHFNMSLSEQEILKKNEYEKFHQTSISLFPTFFSRKLVRGGEYFWRKK